MEIKKTQKNIYDYICINCDFTTCNKTDYSRHILTKKHKGNILEMNGNKKYVKIFICKDCNKQYKTNAGLWKHNKICKQNILNISNEENKQKEKKHIDDVSNKDLINFLMKQNSELMEIIKNGTHITNNTTCNNIINKKTFNLNFFLNETCKDALNITDFVNSIQLQLKDLENTAKEGYIGGISNIIIKELKNLDINKRPIHCSDIKRETLYIKDNDAWEKENQEKIKIKKVIKDVANKNIKQIPNWIKEHPHHREYNHQDNDNYMEILTSCMAGNDNEEDVNQIIKNVSKEIIIDK